MATEFFKFKGKAKWARTTKPDEKYGDYYINVYLDKASKVKFEKSGCQVAPKEDEDGEYIRFRRPDKKLIKSELRVFGPPKIVDKEGNAVAELIGNGSTVVVDVAIYDTQKGKGHRLEEIVVVDLVPYQKDKDEE